MAPRSKSKPPPPFAASLSADKHKKAALAPKSTSTAPSQVKESTAKNAASNAVSAPQDSGGIQTRTTNKNRHPGALIPKQKRRSPAQMAEVRAAEATLLREKEEAERRAAEITAQLRQSQYSTDEQLAGVADVEDFSLGQRAPPSSESDGDFLASDKSDEEEENDVMEVDDLDDFMVARAKQGKKKLNQRDRGREFRKQLEGSPAISQPPPARKRVLSTVSDLEKDKPTPKKPRSSRSVALKTGGITKNWQSRARESQSSQGEDGYDLGGLPTDEEREGPDKEVHAAVATDIAVEVKDVNDSKKKQGRRGNTALTRGKRYGNQHLLLSPDDLQTYQTQLLSTVISFIGTQKDTWSLGTSKSFVDCLQSCYQTFFPDVIKQRPSLIPLNVRAPEYIVTTQRVRSWRNKIGSVAIAEVRKFFKNWTKPADGTDLRPPMVSVEPASLAADTQSTANEESSGSSVQPHPPTVNTDAATTEPTQVAESSTNALAKQVTEENGPNNQEDADEPQNEDNTLESLDLDTVEGRESFVGMMLDKRTHLFIYKDPKSRKGAFESDVILRTYAVHYPHVAASKWDYEESQAGALALVTSAVFRALEAWQDGHEGRATEFSAGKWQKKTAMYFSKASLLSDEAWERINNAAEAYAKLSAKGKLAAMSDDGEDGLPDDEDDDGAGIVVGSD
ncbi:hypothetical protein PQX77_010507 [Marasmius sp. AFHP31]|nr:hypothetical protein PQX77_010507 [Marasmius sp. AFHP31]